MDPLTLPHQNRMLNPPAPVIHPVGTAEACNCNHELGQLWLICNSTCISSIKHFVFENKNVEPQKWLQDLLLFFLRYDF
jgi:hypothetical protein